MTRTSILSLRNSFSALALVALIAVSAPAMVLGKETDCSYAVPVDLNSIHRGRGIDKNTDEIFKFDVSEAGVITIDVFVDGGSESLPRLGMYTSHCKGIGFIFTKTEVLEHSGSHLVIAADSPGPYFFRMSAEDPLLPLGAYKLSMGFVPIGAGPAPFPKQEGSSVPAPTVIATSVVEEDEVDPDPDNVFSPGPVPAPTVIATSVVEEDEVDPDPDNQTVQSTYWCDRERISDDQSDTMTCASYISIGQLLSAELRNDWGDDDDVFRLVLDEVVTVQIESQGGVNTVAELYDHLGQRLGVADGGGDEENFRMIRTLTPGEYFIRVTGNGYSEGSYDLIVRKLDW